MTTWYLRVITSKVEVLKALVDQVRQESQCIEPVCADVDRRPAQTIQRNP